MVFNAPEHFKNKSGIYIIRNVFDDKVYIGKAKHLYTRYRLHKSTIVKSTRTCSQHLRRIALEHGSDKLLFEVLMTVEVNPKTSGYTERYLTELESVFIHHSSNLLNTDIPKLTPNLNPKERTDYKIIY